ncbi:MAG TPA: SigE family RNA polymerase sigma factor [Acidimicrobiales bacterium]|nr:SigE family RNA polymerase sigma factor [Acidimicrobiales bacterium]
MSTIRADGRRAAFDRFVDESTGSLLRTAYLVTGDLGLAEDLVQECLFKIARRWTRVVSMDSPKAYARRVLVNSALDDSKRRSRHRAELERRSPSDPAVPLWWDSEISWGAVSAADDRLELIGALGELARRQRAVLVLRYFDDLTESDVASVLGCSTGTVKSTTSRALEKMRQLLPSRLHPDLEGEPLACSERKGK